MKRKGRASVFTFARAAFLILIFFVGIGTSNIVAQQVSDGYGNWRTIKTANFRIHFRSEYRTFARRMAGICERAHDRLTPKYGVADGPVHVMLIFESDIVNAFATPVGLNRIVLFLDSPELGQFSRYDLWAELLFVHEYTHILTLQHNGTSASSFIRFFFGIPGNLFSPPGFIEGVSVHEESKLPGGRQDDALTDMTIRTEILAGGFPDPMEMLTGSHRWPVGRIPYLYGSRFIKYLARKYGERNLARYWMTPAPPYALEARLYQTFGNAYYYGLYLDFKREETKQAQNFLLRLKSAGITPYHRHTFDGFQKSYLYNSPRNNIYFFATPSNDFSGFYRIGEAGKKEFVRYARSSRGVAMSENKVIHSEDYYEFPIFGLRHELYDASSAFPLHRILPGRQASYPSLSPDGTRIYYISRLKHARILAMRKLEGGLANPTETVFIKIPITGILQFTALSPDGKELAAVVRRGEKDPPKIIVCKTTKVTTEGCRVAVDGPGIKTQPRFSADGRLLYFSSDISGSYDLYAAVLDTGKFYRITRSATGLFYPTPSGKKMYALAYFKNGYDVVSILNRDLFKVPEPRFVAGPFFLDNISQSKVGPDGKASGPKNYKLPPGSTESDYAGPLAMRPYFSGLLKGRSIANLGVAASDPAFRHDFLAVWSYDEPIDYVQAQYSYSRYLLGLLLSYETNYYGSRRNEYCNDRENIVLRVACGERDFQSEEGSISINYIDQGRYLYQQIVLGYQKRKLRNADMDALKEFEARDLNLNGPFIAYLSDFTQRYVESISPEHGFRFFFSGSYYRKNDSRNELNAVLTLPVEYGIVEGGTALYLPSLFKHHVNYISVYGYGSVGPDREVERTSLNRYMRGLSFANAPREHSATVLTFEYRLPLIWLSRELLRQDLMLRGIGLRIFFDYGLAFDYAPRRDYWMRSYGIVLSMGLNLWYLRLPDLQLTIARGDGPAGETQVYLGLELPAGYSQRIDSSPVLKPYRRPLPRSREEPGYFRNPVAGGILE